MAAPDKPSRKSKIKDPLSWETWRHAALVAVLAWAGVGADSLSSANYGPEEAYKALHHGGHEPLVLWLALITALTVVIISLAYVQIIRLFPNGGGGYKAATRLVHPYAGLLSGSALVVDYSLTIAISVAAASDAMFNLTPVDWLQFKPFVLAGGLGLLLFINLRGVKESVTILAPIVFGFLIIHVALIGMGLMAKSDDLVERVVEAEKHVETVVNGQGLWALIAIMATAYAAGAGTYTGIEALSENAQYLKPPRAQTGARAMALIAVSLGVLAGGIMLLYTVWLPTMVDGRTLNAVVFDATLLKLFPDQELVRQIIIGFAMVFAAALLLVAASSGFLGGPAVLAWMAIDKWAPHSFAHLSNKLVAQNGVLTMGVAAGLLLLFTGGQVHSLVVLYSINVFLTFSLSITGLVRYNLANRDGRQSELPNLGERTAATQRRFFAYVIQRKNEVLVRQRPAGVVNASLWEFPNLEVELQNKDPLNAAQKAWSPAFTETAPLCTIKHSITRYRITLEAFRAEVKSRTELPAELGAWYPLEKLHDLPFTSAHGKIRKKLI